jgi:hypothetical protein
MVQVVKKPQHYPCRAHKPQMKLIRGSTASGSRLSTSGLERALDSGTFSGAFSCQIASSQYNLVFDE